MLDRKDPNKHFISFQQLVLKNVDGRTSPKEIYFNNNFKLSPQVHLDNISLDGKDNELVYYLIHTGGGYVTGETVGTNFILEKNAKAILTTVSPSNIYMCKDGQYITSEEYVQVDEGAYLTYICDDIIAYEFSKYQQFNTFKLNKHSHFIYSDMIGPGWSKGGTRYSFDWVKLRSEFYVDDEIYCIDNLRFEPKELDLHALGNLDEYLYMPSIFLYDEKITEQTILELRKYLKETIKLDLEFGISKLNNNAFVVRALVKMEEEGNKFVITCTNWIRKNIWNMAEINFKKY